MNVFGLQPKIRTDLADWAPDLFTTFTYLTNMTKNEYKDKTYKIVDKLFDRFEHRSY
jgi:hypothetical protein